MPLIVVGLGPGPAELLTQEAYQLLTSTRRIVSLPVYCPAFPLFLRNLSVDLLLDSNQAAGDPRPTHDALLTQLLGLAQAQDDVIFAVPGNPIVDDPITLELVAECAQRGAPLRIVAGISLSDWAIETLRLHPTFRHGLSQREAMQVSDAADPDTSACAPDPSLAVLLRLTAGGTNIHDLQQSLLTLYPGDHTVALLMPAAVADQPQLRSFPLEQLIAEVAPDTWGYLYIPRLTLTQNLATFQGLANIVAKLRSPDGCPWDREQTHESLKRYLLEETYEALDALDKGDLTALREELGDILLNILLHCQIAGEAGEFEARDMLRYIAEKLVRRHPHVFGDLKLSKAQEVIDNWEVLKSKERVPERSMLDGLPVSLPALAYTRSLHERLSSLKIDGLGLSKETGRDTEDIDGLGETLFTLAYGAAVSGIDPEEALRHANSRFRQRIAALEEKARSRGASLPELGGAESLKLWQSIQDT